MLYLPLDEFARGGRPNLELAADWLELSAAFSSDGLAFTAQIVDALELSAEADTGDTAKEAESGAIARMAARRRALDKAYPFDIDDGGEAAAYCATTPPNIGQAAYLLSLVLSNLRSISPLLDGSRAHPADGETREMRRYFRKRPVIPLGDC